jgi:hypothetical protein
MISAADIACVHDNPGNANMMLLTTIGLSVLLMLILILGMSIGVLNGRRPIKGSCGGLNGGSCELCGGGNGNRAGGKTNLRCNGKETP